MKRLIEWLVSKLRPPQVKAEKGYKEQVNENKEYWLKNRTRRPRKNANK